MLTVDQIARIRQLRRVGLTIRQIADQLHHSPKTIFKDPMTTAAAIDRLAHHSVIVELNVPSYRLETAKRAKGAKPSQQPEPAATP